jgi:hypothetical protein
MGPATDRFERLTSCQIMEHLDADDHANAASRTDRRAGIDRGASGKWIKLVMVHSREGGRQLLSGMVAPELLRALGSGPATDIRLARKHRRGTEHQTHKNERNDQRVADQMRRDVRSEWVACASTGGILRRFQDRRHGFPWGWTSTE